jgi:hypothetical protein
MVMKRLLVTTAAIVCGFAAQAAPSEFKCVMEDRRGAINTWHFAGETPGKLTEVAYGKNGVLIAHSRGSRPVWESIILTVKEGTALVISYRPEPAYAIYVLPIPRPAGGHAAFLASNYEQVGKHRARGWCEASGGDLDWGQSYE